MTAEKSQYVIEMKLISYSMRAEKN